jgi:predicted nucleic acid-binding protein
MNLLLDTHAYWDSMICSAALEAGCEQLITEDMQHGLLMEDRLKIINPFAQPGSPLF